MPELPEVETVRRVLEKEIVGKTITDIVIKYEPIINCDVEFFKKNVIGKKILSMSRYAKFLIFNLEDGNIISHLRMEGKYFYLKKGTFDNKHVHVRFVLDDGYELLYQDVRKFGRMEYKESSELYSTSPLTSLGVDPILIKEFDYRNIYDKIVLREVPFKTILLDQSIITGLGNIYVDEVLFKAKINPHRPGKTITYDESVRVADYTKEILSKAIEYKGTTIRSYTSSLGVEGQYQQFLQVHTKEICPTCGKKLLKDKINGRSTYYCDNCQR